jgi:hypothetical protein
MADQQTEAIFTTPGIWGGGFYELVMNLGKRSDPRLKAALELLWKHKDLDGCWLDPKVEPREGLRLQQSLRDAPQMHGIATLPDGAKVGCRVFVKRQNLTNGKLLGVPRPDVIHFGIPMGALATKYDVGTFPDAGLGHQDSRPWREKIDPWFVDMAKYIFDKVPYDFAIIGHELNTKEIFRHLESQDAPEIRDWGYIYGNLNNEQTWYPPTDYMF